MGHVDQQTVCSWCLEAGLKTFFSLPVVSSPEDLSAPYLRRNRAPLQRRLESLLAESTCSLCRLLVEALDHVGAFSDLPHGDCGNLDLLYRLQYGLPAANEQPADTDQYLSSNPDWDGLAIEVPLLALSIPGRDVQVRLQRMRHPTDAGGEPLFGGRPIKPHADVELIKLWLEECETFHQCQTDLEPYNFSAWIIDVEEACLVACDTAVQESRYAALSYVWGPRGTKQLKNLKDTRERLKVKGGLSARHGDVPHTILDAMTLCSNLHIRYLWVDALCIEQEAGYLLEGLLNMRGTYGKASLTIACVDGPDSWHGLPGVGRPRPRRPLDSTCTVDGVTIGVAASPASKVHRGVWNSRAWTYQEQVLSRRIIYFTDDEVLFGCDGGILWREGMQLEPRHVHELTRRLGHDDHTLTSHGPTKVMLSEKRVLTTMYLEYPNYMEHLQHYVDRHLTNDEDTLKAFEGIADVYTVRLSTDHFEGHPISYFTELMHFTYEQPNPRSSQELFPSWSWCYWKGPIRIQPKRTKLRSQVTWYRAHAPHTSKPEPDETHAGQPARRVDLTPNVSSPHSVHELSRLEGPMLDVEQDPVNLAERLDRLSLRLPDTASKYLKYIIVGEMQYHHIAVGRESIPEDKGNPSTQFPIIDARFRPYGPTRQSGTICIEADWRQSQPDQLEFVYLSLEQLHIDTRRDGSNIYVNAMLIETDSNGLSRRVQLHQFQWHIWARAYNGPPSTRWVCLR